MEHAMTGEPENWPIRMSNRGETLERHPLSANFPEMLPQEFQGLVDSIDDQGQIEPVILYEGMVLDGWQRVLACRTFGILPKTALLPEGSDPLA
jgi:ParB-like chromosome segregation protein Spo0J